MSKFRIPDETDHKLFRNFKPPWRRSTAQADNCLGGWAKRVSPFHLYSLYLQIMMICSNRKTRVFDLHRDVKLYCTRQSENAVPPNQILIFTILKGKANYVHHISLPNVFLDGSPIVMAISPRKNVRCCPFYLSTPRAQ